MSKYFLTTKSLIKAAKCLSGQGWEQAVRIHGIDGKEILEYHRVQVREDLNKDSIGVNEAVEAIKAKVTPEDFKLMQAFDRDEELGKKTFAETKPEIPEEVEPVEPAKKSEPTGADAKELKPGEEANFEKVTPKIGAEQQKISRMLDVLKGAKKNKKTYNSITVDQMNDFAARYIPELEIKPNWKKATIITKLIDHIQNPPDADEALS